MRVQFKSDGSYPLIGSSLKFRWDFGDGSPTSFLANPEHLYERPGTYTAKLTASDDYGHLQSRDLEIVTSNSAPQVHIVEPVGGAAFSSGDQFQFRAEANDEEDGDNLSFRWEVRIIHSNHQHLESFVSEERQPIYLFQEHDSDGGHFVYRLICTVTDSLGASSSDAIDFRSRTPTSNSAPTAVFSHDRITTVSPFGVSFNGSASVDPDSDLLAYDWDFGDGFDRQGSATTHFYETPGAYLVSLRVADSFGAMKQTTQLLSLPSSVLSCDPGFEESLPDGTPPDACWKVDWTPEGSGALVTLTAANTGSNGLWLVTDRVGARAFATAYQEVSAAGGDVFEATVKARAVPDSWPPHSRGVLQMLFLSGHGDVLRIAESPPVNEGDVEWRRLTTGQAFAPHGTSKVRYRLMVEKPGGEGIAVVNFDDCALLSVPMLLSQPPDMKLRTGDRITISTRAAASNLTYQWFVGKTGETNTPIAGATSPTLDLPPLSVGGHPFWMRASASDGSPLQDTDTVTVAIIPQGICDPGFEESTPNGEKPDSGCWSVAWRREAGAIVTSGTARKGRNGLYAFTGQARDDYYAIAYQSFPAREGQTFEGVAYARRSSDFWPTGTRASVEIVFLGPNGEALDRYASSQEAMFEWTRLTTKRKTAPKGTASVRYILIIEKPIQEGIAVANFDDTYLTGFETIVVHPQDIKLDESQTAELSVVASAPWAAYQWFEGESGDTNHPIAFARSQNYSPGILLSGLHSFWVRVYDQSGYADSRTATVHVSTRSTLLCDSGFEESSPFGTAPDSGCWVAEWIGGGGAITTTTSRHSGANGLWAFTGFSSEENWASLYQDLTVHGGELCEAHVYARSVPDSWPLTGEGLLRLTFLTDGNETLASYESSLVTTDMTNWFDLTTGKRQAPIESAKVRFELLVRKSNEPGVPIVNFDGAGLNIEALNSVTPEFSHVDVSQPTVFRVRPVSPEPAYQWYFGVTGETDRPITGATNSTFNTGLLMAGRHTFWVRTLYQSDHKDSATTLVSVNDTVKGQWKLSHFTAEDLANPEREVEVWGDNADPDRDGQPNAFEFIAGTSPTLSASRFRLELLPHGENAKQLILRFGPIHKDCNYELHSSTSLFEAMRPTEDLPTLNGEFYEFLFTPSPSANTFFRVLITAPE